MSTSSPSLRIVVGLYAGLVTGIVLLLFWLLYLKPRFASKGWRYIAYSWELLPVAVLLGSLHGLLRLWGVVHRGSLGDTVLAYSTALLYCATLVILLATILFDALKTSRARKPG